MSGGGPPPNVSLNLNVRGLQPSVTLAINERCNQLRAEGRQVFKLGLGQSPFPVPGPVVEELRANAFQKDYLPVRGLDALRCAVADYHRRTQGAQCTSEDVLIGPGSKELLFLLQLVYYGDIEIPTPAWVSYAPQARIAGRHIEWRHTQASHGFRVDPEMLAQAWSADPSRPRLLILNYPSNPTGASYDATTLERLASVCARHKAVVLSDEIYGELHYEGRHLSISRYYPEGTIISSGLSKWCGAGGWRLGTFAFPRSLSWLLQAIAVVASETFTSTSAPIQYAAVRAFSGGEEIERYLHESRRVLRAMAAWICDHLESTGAHLHRPDGAFYVFPDFGPLRERLAKKGVHSSTQLARQLLEQTGVAVLPGHDFGRPDSELTARLAFVDFDGARMLTAAEGQRKDAALDRQFFETYAPNVVHGIERLAAWVQE